MRWLKTFSLTLGWLLFGGVLLLASFLLFIGNSDLGGAITWGVETLTDHTIELDGPVTIELSMSPLLKTTGVYFRMQDETVELQADDLKLQLDLLPLKDGYIQVKDIGAHNTSVTIRLPADDVPDEDAGQDINIRAMTFDHIDVVNLAVDIYQSYEIEPLHINLDQLQAQRNTLGVLTPITARGSVDGEPFSLDGSVARGEAERAEGRSFIVDVRFEVLQSLIHASGEIAGASDAAPSGELDVRIDMPDVQAVLQLLHIGMPDMGALTATGQLTGTPDALRLDGLEASLAREGVSVEVQGTVANLNTGSGMDLSYTSDISDAGLLAWFLPDQVPQFHTLGYAAHVTGHPGQLAIVMERFKATDADGHALDVSGKAVVLDDEPYIDDLEMAVSASMPNLDYVRQFSEAVPKLGPVKATANVTVNDGVLAIRDIKATSSEGSKGRVNAEGEITRISFTPQVDVSGMDFKVKVENVTTQQIGDAVDLELPNLGPVQAQAHYSGSDKKSIISDLKLKGGYRGRVLLDATGEIRLGDMASDNPLAGLNLDVAMQTPDSAWLGVLTGVNVPSLGAFRGAAKVSEANGVTVLHSLDASITRGNDFSAELTGSMGDVLTGTGINMKLSMKAADLYALGSPFDMELPREGAVNLAGDIQGSLEKLRYTSRADLGNTVIQSDLTGAFGTGRPYITGSIEIPMLDVGDLGFHPEQNVQQASKMSDEGFTKPVHAQPKETVRLFNDEPIDFSGLKSVDLDLKVSVDAVSHTDFSLKKSYTHVVLKDGLLELKRTRFAVEENQVITSLTIDSRPAVPTAGLTFDATDLELGQLFKTSPDKPAPIRGVMAADIDLRTSGRTTAELGANLGGSIHSVAENAKVDKGLVNLINLDVLGWVLSNTLSLKKDVNIGCAIFSMTFDQGVGETDMFIIDMPDTLIRIDADIDLRDETLYIAILPKRKRGLLGSKKPMEIHGPITNPEYKMVSLGKLTMETSRAVLLSPLTITHTVLGNVETLLGTERKSQGTCSEFIDQ